MVCWLSVTLRSLIYALWGRRCLSCSRMLLLITLNRCCGKYSWGSWSCIRGTTLPGIRPLSTSARLFWGTSLILSEALSLVIIVVWNSLIGLLAKQVPTMDVIRGLVLVFVKFRCGLVPCIAGSLWYLFNGWCSAMLDYAWVIVRIFGVDGTSRKQFWLCWLLSARVCAKNWAQVYCSQVSLTCRGHVSCDYLHRCASSF